MKYTARAILIASTVLALNLLPFIRLSNRCASGPNQVVSRLAITAASPKAQRNYGLPSLAARNPLILPAEATVPLTSRQ